MHGRGVSLDGVRVGVRHPSEGTEVAGGGRRRREEGPVGGGCGASLQSSLPCCPTMSRKREEESGGDSGRQADDQWAEMGVDVWARSVGCGNGMCSPHRCHCRGNCNDRGMDPKGCIANGVYRFITVVWKKIVKCNTSRCKIKITQIRKLCIFVFYIYTYIFIPISKSIKIST